MPKTIKEFKNKIIQGDCLEVLKEIPDESIDCVITSPPYWSLRDYKIEGQIGLEENFDKYLNKLLEIFAEIKRVLKKSGSFWLNMGDTFKEKCMMMQPERSWRRHRPFCYLPPRTLQNPNFIQLPP